MGGRRRNLHLKTMRRTATIRDQRHGRRRQRPHCGGMATASASNFGVALLLMASMHQSNVAVAAAGNNRGGASSSVVYLDETSSFDELQHRHLQYQQQARMTSIELHQQLYPQNNSPHEQHNPQQSNSPHQQRRLANNPFLPDYTSKLCTNANPAESWQTNPPKTASECCNLYFSWEYDKCEEGSMMWVLKDVSDNYSTGGGGGEKVEYYPDSSQGICLEVNSLKPSWITTTETDYGICCSKHLAWSLEKCLRARPVPTSLSGRGDISGDSEGGTVVTTQRTNKPTTPPPPSPKTPTASGNNVPSSMLSSQALSDQCSRLSRRQCNQNEPYCVWKEGRDKCTAGSAGDDVGGNDNNDGGMVQTSANSSSNSSSNKPASVDCNGLKRSDCSKVDGCGWERKVGCVSEAPAPKSSSSSLSSPKGSTTSSSTSNSNPPPAPKEESINCSSAKSEASCLMHSTQCRWRDKKRVCSAALSSTTSSLTSDIASDMDESMLYIINGEIVEVEQWYYDTGDGKCKPNSPNRPSWLNDLYDDPNECCSKSWDSTRCAAALPEEPSLEDLAGDAGSDGATNGGGGDNFVAVDSWYFDMGDELCKPNGPTKPSWLNDIYDDPVECCARSYKEEACMKSVNSALEALHNDAINGSGVGTTVKLSPEDDPSGEFILIDLTAYGSLQLTLDSLPAKNSNEWNTLKRALTKTLLLIMVDGCSSWVHADMEELELWYIGSESFTWRRNLQGDGKEEEDGKEEMREEKDATTQPSALRGNQVRVSQQGHHRRMSQTYELKWEMLIPAKCNASCQSNRGGSQLGTNSPFPQINTCFAHSVTSGNFEVLLKNIGVNMGLFRQSDEPSARDAELSYRYAAKSSNKDDWTWQPSPTPTISPTDVTNSPTDDIYYADSVNNVCTTTDTSFGFNTNKFGTIKSCCEFEWMGNYDICVAKSFKASMPTGRPTKMSTPRPSSKTRTARPTKRRPTGREPQDSGPTRPTGQTATGSGGTTVFYPDLTLGVCKFDGKHGNNPYQFLTAEACCTNKWMDYDKCMAYANPYYSSANAPIYYPDVYEGYCKSDGGHVGLDDRLVFRSVEECCDNVWMVEAECLVKSKNSSTGVGGGGGGSGSGSDSNYSGGSNNFADDNGACKWYPDPSNFGTCTYSSQYPEHWDTTGLRDSYLFDTHDICCQAAFGGLGCGQKFNCNGFSSGLTSDGVYISDAPTGMTDYPTFNPTTVSRPNVQPNSSPSIGWSDGSPSEPTGVSSPTAPSPTRPTAPSPTRPTAVNDNPGPTPTLSGVIVGGATPKPTVKYIPPPDVSLAIDATGITKEIKDGFEDGISGTWPWVTTEALPWIINSDDKTEGQFSVRSHAVESGEKSDLSVAIQSSYGGVMYFDFKTDVKMPYSGCYINIDGESKVGYTFPKEDWLQKTLAIAEGEHVVMFRAWAPTLSSPATPSDVSNTIALDNVSFMPNLLEDFEGGKLAWGNDMKFEGQNSFWRFDWNKAHTGKVAIRTPSSLNNGQSTAMSYEVFVPRRGSTLSFWYFCQAAKPFDSLAFKVDGMVVLEVTEIKEEWEEYTQNLTPGTHKLSWHYERLDSSGEHPGDSGFWIDDIKITGKS